MHYLRKDATHWTDAETGERVSTELAAKLEAKWQTRDSRIKADAAMSGYRADASLSERAARAVAGDKLTPEQRKAVIKAISETYPDFVGNDKSDVYLVTRLEAMRANENRASRSEAPADEHDAASEKRMKEAEKADSDPRADTMRARDASLEAILNMHRTGGSRHTATAHDGRNDTASVIASMSKPPVDRGARVADGASRASVAHDTGDKPSTPSVADILADMSKPGAR